LGPQPILRTEYFTCFNQLQHLEELKIGSCDYDGIGVLNLPVLKKITLLTADFDDDWDDHSEFSEIFKSFLQRHSKIEELHFENIIFSSTLLEILFENLRMLKKFSCLLVDPATSNVIARDFNKCKDLKFMKFQLHKFSWKITRSEFPQIYRKFFDNFCANEKFTHCCSYVNPYIEFHDYGKSTIKCPFSCPFEDL
jgi:hypothetical protein